MLTSSLFLSGFVRGLIYQCKSKNTMGLSAKFLQYFVIIFFIFITLVPEMNLCVLKHYEQSKFFMCLCFTTNIKY